MEGNLDNLEIWIWKATKSGSVGRPPNPDFWKKVKKSALKSLDSLNLDFGTTFFAKKG
jgi:hypothetical protein